MWRKLILMFTVLSLTVGFGQNLVVNGDFEAWTANAPDSWTTIESGITLNAEDTPAFVHGGTYSMATEVTTGDQGVTDFRQSVDVVADETYDISVWVYHADNEVQARLYVGDYKNYSDNTIVGAWQEMTYSYTATTTGSIEVGLRFYDQASFDVSSTVYIDDYTMVVGVPPVPTAYTITEIQTPDTGGDLSQYNGEFVETSGVVTAMGSYFYFIQDGTADYSGIYIYEDSDALTLGDDVTVVGTVAEYNGLTRIESVTDVTINSSANTLPAARVLTTGMVAAEINEGMLIATEGTCTAVSDDPGSDRWLFQLDDGSGAAYSDDAIFTVAPIVDNSYTLTGPLTYYYSNYQILARDAADVVGDFAVPTAYTITEIQTPDAGGDASQHVEELIETSGVVTGLGGYYFFIQDGTADYSGIYIYEDSDALALGDNVTIVGTVEEYYGLTRIESVSEQTINSSGNALPDARVLTTGMVAAEINEGLLATTSGTCTAFSTNPGGDYWLFQLDDGSGVAYGDDGIFAPTFTVDNDYQVTGPVTYSRDHYQILVRDADDVIETIPGPYVPVDFEVGGYGADWAWTVGENGTDPALEIIANPVSGGMNTSATVAKFTALLTGQPWALFHSDGIGLFTFDATNSTVKIMVYKPVISDVGMKFEGAGAVLELKVPNTLTNEWEELTFDFSSLIGSAYSKIVIIPDFDFTPRTQDNIVYLDNIAFSEQVIIVEPGPYAPVDFEADGNGADWAWTVGENGTDPALEIIANPVSGGMNTSATVAKFTALLTGQPWALFHSDGIGLFTFDATNSTVKIMVYKPVISDVGMKFEGAGAVLELKVPNTLTNEWEELTFDFSSLIGSAYSKIVIIPDFDFTPRTQDNIVYLDNIAFSEEIVVEPDPGLFFSEYTEGSAGNNKYVEIYNPTEADIDLSSYSVQGSNNGSVWGASGNRDVSLTGTLAAGDVYVIAADEANADILALADLALAYESPVHHNGNDGIALLKDGLIVDAIGVDNVDPGVAWDVAGVVEATKDHTLIRKDDVMFGNIGDWAMSAGTDAANSQWIVADPATNDFTPPTLGWHIIPPVIPGPHVPVDFEVDGHGADWAWTVGENGTDPALEIIANPVSGGMNTSATVAKFTALLTGQPWALFHSDGIGLFTFDATNSTVKIMVYKPVISDVGMKFEGAGAVLELKVPNTLTNEWEELTFDFSSLIGSAYSKIVIIPDFDFTPRTQDNIVYLDNISFNSTTTGIEDNQIPDNFALKQNYPNPFNPSTTIRYSLIESGQVVLKLYNITGQEVATLVDAMSSAGEYSYYFNASDLAAGTYLYSLTAGNQTIVKKMVLIK